MKISEVILYSHNIQEQKSFYKSILGFEMLLDTSEKISFKAGASVLTFQYKDHMQPSHVAFNIPYNAIYDALNWLRRRTDVLTNNNEFISDFSGWKAKAIYFHDADKNIMEFIARERIDIESDVAFIPRLILSISEMAIATNNIEAVYNTINNIKPIPIFDGNF